MTIGCVSLSEVKQFLRLDHDAEDGLLTSMIEMATEMIETRIRRPVVGESENAVASEAKKVPASIRLAAAVIVAFLYENRTATDTEIRDRVMRQAALDQYIDWGPDDGTAKDR